MADNESVPSVERTPAVISRLPYSVSYGPEHFVAEAPSFRAGILALRTMKDEVVTPSVLSLRNRKGQVVAWVNASGTIGTFQGSENW